MVAVITDVHYRMSLALIRSLGEQGIDIVCCEKESERYPLGFYSKYCKKSVTLPDDEALQALYRLCEELHQEYGEKPLLFPVGATTLYSLSEKNERSRFRNVACFFIPSKEQLDLFNSKPEVARIGRDCAIAVPTEYEPPYEDIVYPCIVKPAFGEKFGLTAAKRYRIARSEEELHESIAFYEKLTGESPLVQQYLGGAGAGCSVLCKDGVIYSAICHKRLREYPISGGPSTCCLSFHSEELFDNAAKLVNAVRYNGIAMVEFKYDQMGKPHLLEINPRIWGTFPLTRVSKSNFIDQWLRLTKASQENASEVITSPETASAAVASREASQENALPEVAVGALGQSGTSSIFAHRYQSKKMVYTISDLLAGIGYAKKGRIGKLFGAILDFFNPFTSDGLWEWSDVKPGLVYLKSLFNRRK